MPDKHRAHLTAHEEFCLHCTDWYDRSYEGWRRSGWLTRWEKMGIPKQTPEQRAESFRRHVAEHVQQLHERDCVRWLMKKSPKSKRGGYTLPKVIHA